MMKLDKIISILDENAMIDDYVISLNRRKSSELFYAKKSLELNRFVEVESISVEIYVDHDEYRGSSNVVITAADNVSSFKRKLGAAIRKARAINNPWFPIAEKCADVDEGSLEEEDLNKLSAKAAKAIFKADNREDVWLSATEIFASIKEEEIITSKGNHHRHCKFELFIEVIPTVRHNDSEFEVYKAIRKGYVKQKEIEREIAETMDDALLRAKAHSLSEVEIDKDVLILIGGDMLENIVDGFASELSYRTIYNHQNHFIKGDEVADGSLNIKLDHYAKGCLSSKGFDKSGLKLTSKTIIRNGKAIGNYGELRYAHYLKKKATGNLPIIILGGEAVDYHHKKHLLIKNFSSPQYESSSGYFGGEVRLALYYDGNEYIPLTGFSIAGNIYNDIRNVKVSKEETIMSYYKGPKYLIFSNLSIY